MLYKLVMKKMITWAEWIGYLTHWSFLMLSTLSWFHKFHGPFLSVAEALHLWDQSFCRLYRSRDPSPTSITTSRPKWWKILYQLTVKVYQTPVKNLSSVLVMNPAFGFKKISIFHSKFSTTVFIVLFGFRAKAILSQQHGLWSWILGFVRHQSLYPVWGLCLLGQLMRCLP